MINKLLEKNALRWVNKVRRIYGEPHLENLIKGKRKESRKCVIAQSSANIAKVTAGSIFFFNSGLKVHRQPLSKTRTPFLINKFIRRFDDGCFPHLDIDFEQPPQFCTFRPLPDKEYKKAVEEEFNVTSDLPIALSDLKEISHI